MNDDRVLGAAENIAGRTMVAMGGILADDHLIAQGNAHRVSGKLRNVMGAIREAFGWDPRITTSSPKPADRSWRSSFEKDTTMNEDEIKGAVRQVTGKVEKGIGDITSDTKWQADGVVDQVAGGAQKLYGRAKDKVQDVIDDAPDALADASDRVRDAAQRGQRLASDQVKDNPWALVAIAGIAGYALSWALHGRRN